MEQAAQVWWDKMINFICKKISDRMEQSQSVFTIPGQPGKHASPIP